MINPDANIRRTELYAGSRPPAEKKAPGAEQDVVPTEMFSPTGTLHAKAMIIDGKTITWPARDPEKLILKPFDDSAFVQRLQELMDAKPMPIAYYPNPNPDGYVKPEPLGVPDRNLHKKMLIVDSGTDYAKPLSFDDANLYFHNPNSNIGSEYRTGVDGSPVWRDTDVTLHEFGHQDFSELWQKSFPGSRSTLANRDDSFQSEREPKNSDLDLNANYFKDDAERQAFLKSQG